MIGGKQLFGIGDGCVWVGTVMHEAIHALGFGHEQNRPGSFIFINITSIDKCF